jgi:CheY-like chemotaxis protein
MYDKAVFLLVEDSADDVLLIKRAFQKANIANPLYVVPSGENAMLYLSGEGPYRNREEFPLPAVILLDLKLPGKDGFEVLEWIRTQPGLSNLRVIVLTASDAMRDADHAYKLGANSFLTKPVQLDRLAEMMQALKGYWIWYDSAPTATRPPRAKQSRARSPKSKTQSRDTKPGNGG